MTEHIPVRPGYRGGYIALGLVLGAACWVAGSLCTSADSGLPTLRARVLHFRWPHCVGCVFSALVPLGFGLYAQRMADRRRQALSALQSSETRYRTLAESADDAIFVINRRDEIDYVNPAASSWFNSRPADMIGRPRAEFFAGPSGDQQRRALTHVLETGHAASGISLTPFPSGPVWLATRLTPILDQQGRAQAVLGVSRDMTDLKAGEEGLRHAEAWNRALLEAMPDTIFQFTRSGVALYYKPAAGFQPIAPIETFLNKPVADVLPPELARRFRKTLELTLTTRQVQVMEYLAPAGDEEHCFEGRMVPHGDDRVLYLIRDITERRRTEEALHKAHEELEHRVAERTAELSAANTTLQREIAARSEIEAALRESRNELQAIHDGMVDGILIANCHTRRFLQSNPAMQRMLGYTAAELATLGVEDVHASEDLAAVLSDFQALESGARDFVNDIPMLRRNGTSFYADIGARKIRFRDQDCLIGFFRDVTERHQADAALRESEAKFRTLADTVPAGIVISRGEIVVYANPGANVLTGYDLGELLNRSFAFLIHPDDRALVSSRELGRQRGMPAPARYEFRILTRQGEERWVDYTAATIDYDGAPALLGTAFDVTAGKRAEALARQRQTELAHVARLNTMGEMAAELAHEINQPLAAIANYAHGCLRRIQSGSARLDELVPALEQVASQAGRASDIIRRTRAFLSRRDFARTTVHINALVGEVLELLEHEARMTGTRVTVDPAPDLPALLVDRIQIQQVLFNLIRNALEAQSETAPDVREVVVRTSLHPEGLLEISVTDRGPGIPAEVLESVFEPFFTTKPEGMGMGLPICRSIIAEHGGRLWACPESQGATFRFTLPLPGTPLGNGDQHGPGSP